MFIAAGEIPTAGPALPGAVTGITQASNISRQSRRLYVGNIPFGITEVSHITSIKWSSSSENTLRKTV